MSKKIFEIYTVKDFIKINEFISNYESSDYSDYIVKVMNDLDFKSKPWAPLGRITIYGTNVFKGEFDGQGHTIKNLKINDNSTDMGFICYNTGYIHDLCLDNTCYITGCDYVGSICGMNEGIILNCKSAANVKGHNYVGGICGESTDIININATIKKSSFYGKVDGHIKVGGICGYSCNTCSNLVNTGTVIGENYIGGVCGISKASFHDIRNAGKVNGENFIGGIFGSVSSDDFKNIENCGTVKGHSSYGDIFGSKL
jgi:hypothetical protein